MPPGKAFFTVFDFNIAVVLKTRKWAQEYHI